MKRIMCCSLALILALAGFMGIDRYLIKERSLDVSEPCIATADNKAAKGLKVKCKSAVLMDAGSGAVLFAQNANKKLPPASVTKVMTMLLIVEAIEKKQLRLDEKVTISERAASMGGSQMYMEPGEKHTLEELMMGIAMVSANDACVAVAEHLAGSVEIFVENMNKRAQQLGMKNTNFVNTNGLPVTEHYTSAYDIAVMSRELIDFKKTAKWFTTWQKDIKVGLPGKKKDFTLSNTNKLVKFYDGAIGIKTGFTQEAGYCLSGAAKRGDTVLIAVVLGAETSPVRFAEISKLLDFGFAGYETVSLGRLGECKKKIRIEKGSDETVNAVLAENADILVEKGNRNKISSKIKMNRKIQAPVEKGTQLGWLVVYNDGKETAKIPLTADKKVESASVVDLYIRMMKKLI